MAKTVTYTYSLFDRMTAPMKTITGASVQTTDKLSRLQTQSKVLQAATKDLGGSLSTLRQRMDLLRAEKELINPKNIKDIRSYNREIQSLEKQIDQLDNAGKKGGLSSYFGNLKNSIGGFVNPLTIAVAGVGMATRGGMNLDQQFAKVNTTAQLEGKAFEKMKSDIITVARKNRAEVAVAPEAYEKIISQTNDVEQSMSILDSTFKGSKAGFTEVSVVADALAQSMSIIGKNNASAGEILDTFFAAKRVGAGEFKDFANYMPGLIAGADALGFKYKEVAGVFAYMTGKGQSAERASVLMNNMFSMLGRGEVVGKLKKAGINVFDNGKLRSSVDIFRDMSAVMSSMNDQQKSNFVEALGIVDKEAQRAFMIMTADVDKLKSSLTEVANSAGETDKALALSVNTVQRAQELWYLFKGKLDAIGTAALPIVNAGITFLGGALEVTSSVVAGTAAIFGGWYDMLEDGNPLIWGLTTALAAAGTMLLGSKVKLMAVSAWNSITAATTGILSRALVFLNTSMLASPVGWLMLGVGALAGAMYAFSTKTDKATKSFAQFNVELSKSKSEAKGSFDAAMQAAEGSDARKEAIRKLNEQYGTYLPSLLTEKSSNNELAGALSLVNLELEKKLRLKFRDQARETLESALNNSETALYEAALSGLDNPHAKKAMAEKVKEILPKMQSGELNFGEARKELTGAKIGLQDGITRAGIGTKYISDYFDSVKELNNGIQLLNVQYAEPAPVSSQVSAALPVPTIINNYGNSWTNPQVNGTQWASPNAVLPQIAQSPVATVTGNGNTDAQNNAIIASLNASKGGNGGGSVSTSNVFNLDQQVANIKGSTAYNAVVSKLNRVKIAGLTAASVAGLSISSPALSVPQVSEGSSTQISAIKADNEEYNNQRNRTLNLDKFCDQIVIHIAKADDQGVDQIRGKIMQVLKEIADRQYDA